MAAATMVEVDAKMDGISSVDEELCNILRDYGVSPEACSMAEALRGVDEIPNEELDGFIAKLRGALGRGIPLN